MENQTFDTEQERELERLCDWGPEADPAWNLLADRFSAAENALPPVRLAVRPWETEAATPQTRSASRRRVVRYAAWVATLAGTILVTLAFWRSPPATIGPQTPPRQEVAETTVSPVAPTDAPASTPAPDPLLADTDLGWDTLERQVTHARGKLEALAQGGAEFSTSDLEIGLMRDTMTRTFQTTTKHDFF